MNDTRSVVGEAFRKYYYEHHDRAILETELINAIEEARVSGFMEAKNSMLEVLELKIIEVQNSDPCTLYYTFELEKLRKYVSDLVMKRDNE